jgi:protein-tyrosine phosphatase
MMVTEIDEKLYLGNALDAKALQWDNPLNIRAVINVSYEPDEPVDGIKNVHVPMMDNGNIPAKAFDVALSAIAENLRSGPVLVHCAMGVSRSVVVVALYLALNSRISLNTALERVQQLHAQANPAPGTVDSGKRYFNHW